MERYNYYYEMYNDVKQAVEEWLYYNNDSVKDCDGDLMELMEDIYEDLWIDDAVTGNGSGSYTFSSFTAAQYLAGNYDILQEAFDEFGYNSIELNNIEPEYFDVTIRCYLLGEILDTVLSDMMDEKEGE